MKEVIAYANSSAEHLFYTVIIAIAAVCFIVGFAKQMWETYVKD